MHELSVAMSLVDEARQIAKKERASRVLSITVSIGQLSGVEVEPLKFSFPLAAEGTPIESAQLKIVPVEAKIACEDCGQESSLADFSMCCPSCESRKTNIVQGREIVITSMEIEYDV